MVCAGWCALQQWCELYFASHSLPPPSPADVSPCLSPYYVCRGAAAVGAGRCGAGIRLSASLPTCRHLLPTPLALSAGEQQQKVLGDLEREFASGLRRQLGTNRTVGLGL